MRCCANVFGRPLVSSPANQWPSPAQWFHRSEGMRLKEDVRGERLGGLC